MMRSRSSISWMSCDLTTSMSTNLVLTYNDVFTALNIMNVLGINAIGMMIMNTCKSWASYVQMKKELFRQNCLIIPFWEQRFNIHVVYSFTTALHQSSVKRVMSYFPSKYSMNAKYRFLSWPWICWCAIDLQQLITLVLDIVSTWIPYFTHVEGKAHSIRDSPLLS